MPLCDRRYGCVSRRRRELACAAARASLSSAATAPQQPRLTHRPPRSCPARDLAAAITRDSRHKRRETGGRRHVHQKQRKFESGRPAAMTKMGPKRIHVVRGRGGNLKYRAMRLETGNFSWAGEHTTHKTRVMDVVYNASNNELVRTKTLVKGAVVLVDATPFKQYYETHYRTVLKKKAAEGADDKKFAREVKPAEGKAEHATVLKKYLLRQKELAAGQEVDPKVEEQLTTGRLMAVISARPGQSGRLDGYILEGPELEFYHKKLALKKSGKHA